MANVIKKIELDLGNEQVTLTMEQTKKLKDALDELFGKNVVKEIHHHDYWRWWEPDWSTTTIEWPYRLTTSGGCVASYDSNSSSLALNVA